MVITIKLYQENSLNNLFLRDFKSFAPAVSFLKLFHEFTMRIKKNVCSNLIEQVLSLASNDG